MIAVTSRKETKKGQELASETIMINPEIIEKSEETII
jgi:peptide deformylase